MGRDEAIERFIAHWTDAGCTEVSQCHPFIFQLCAAIGVPAPDEERVADDNYAFERKVRFQHDDGRCTVRKIDCYKRGCFVLEAKRARRPSNSRASSSKTQTDLTDEAMARALHQARAYAHALDEWPPFLVLVDIGRCIELWADFSGLGKHYAPYPDRRACRIELEDLRNPHIQERLRAVWTAPRTLDPAHTAALATRDIARDLGGLLRSVAGRTGGEDAAWFVAQCMFAMFCQDIELLPERAFSTYLDNFEGRPDVFSEAVGNLFKAMLTGGRCDLVRPDIPHFGGRLLKRRVNLPLTAAELDLLARAAGHKWHLMEPTFFGAMVEQATGAEYRARHGVHFTSRELVEAVVGPTIIDPLRREWEVVLSGALKCEQEGLVPRAHRLVRKFHHRLLALRVLDPACGTGNFLYVAMQALQDLEDEVLSRLARMGGEAPPAINGFCVSPRQFLGIEQRALSGVIAETMLWVGFIQRQVARHHQRPKRAPLTDELTSIEIRDALLDPPTAGMARNPSPIATLITDRFPVDGGSAAAADLARQRRPRRKATWPAADFIIGNPPFLSANRQRQALGDGYVQSLWETRPRELRSADLSLYWWDMAAEILTQPDSRLRRFGFITSNSVEQPLSRRVLDRRSRCARPLRIIRTLRDQAWRRDPGSAKVRVAVLVAEAGEAVPTETSATLVNARPVQLKANAGLSFRGVTLGGAGFLPPAEVVRALLAAHETRPLMRRLVNGRDLTGRPREAWALDTFGYDEDELRMCAPAAYRWLLESVKPVRALSAREGYRKRWWRLAEERPDMRAALQGHARQIVTPMTAKHRVFHFLSADDLPDQGLICLAFSDGYSLGVLSSRAHRLWALRQGGALEDRPRYNNSRCFETFPWPLADGSRRGAIGDLAEELDAQRRLALRVRPDLTYTKLYNLLAFGEHRLPPGAEAVWADAKLAGIARLHRLIDLEIVAAYGWADDLDAPAIVAALARLNAQRAVEEGRRVFRRPGRSEGPSLVPSNGADDIDFTWALPQLPDHPGEVAQALMAALRKLGRPVGRLALAGGFQDGSRSPNRERVRRALNSLYDSGFVQKTEDGLWFVPQSAEDRAA